MRAGREVFVSSPELCFVQMGTLFPFPQLVEMGFELCGTYCLPVGGTDGFCRGLPLTDSVALRSFAEKEAAGERGVVAARKALRFVASGSASPQETVLAMLLCLPSCFGGCGFPMPKMNHRIEMPLRGRHSASKRYFLCDLFWPEAQLAVEYDSDRHHTGADRIADDANRRAALARRGIEVVTVTNRQMRNLSEFDLVVGLLAKRLGKRMRPRSRDRAAKQRELRRALLSPSSDLVAKK